MFNTADDPPTAMKLSVPLLCAPTASSTSAQNQPVRATTGIPAQEQDTMCLERITAGSFQTMAAHPDGSGQVFLSTRDGKICVATMPRQGSGCPLWAHPFLDLTDRVHHDAVLGLMGVAFHPEFGRNGRFFVSYNCDSSSSPACGAGRCWGGAGENGSRPCRYQLVVAEFSAEGGADYSKAAAQAVFLPSAYAGQILFRPGDSDGYLYLITGHGDCSKKGRRSLFGKIIRFNVGGGGWSSQQTGTPKMTDKPEIFAVGLNNPSAFTFDSDMPSHLLCAGVNEQRYESVYLVTKDGNSGSPLSSNASAVSLVINRGRAADGRMPSIVGGVVYRGSADPSLNARYLYVYSSGVWSRQ